MAREVELHDGTILEFPDEATDEVIDRAVKAHLAQSAQPATAMTPQELEASNARLTPGVSTDPTSGNGFFDNAAAAYGSAMPRLLRGGRQLLTDAVGAASPYPNPIVAQESQRLQQQEGAIRQDEGALMNTGGGLVGNFVGSALPMVALPGTPAATLSGRFAAAGAQGAAYGAAQPLAEGESRGFNTALGATGGIGGQGIASGLNRIAKVAAEKLSPVVRQSIEAARAAGIPLNVAQVTNSGPIRALQAATRYLPFSGAAKAGKAQQEAFNRAVARSFGEDAPTLSDEVMRGARRKLGDQFDDIYGRNEVAITPDVARRMAQIEANAARDLTGDEAGRVSRQFQRILDDAGDGAMTGDKYKSLRGAIKKLEDNTQTGQYFRELRQQLDDAAVQSVGPDDAARLARIRGQYANLRVAEDALKQVSGAAGDIRPASLYPLIRKGSTKEMRELAKIGQNVLKETINDSGSAQRGMYQNLVGAGIGVGAMTGLGKLAAGGLMAGRALNTNTASKLLQQGRPMQGLARLAQPAPKLLPVASMAAAPLVIDIVGGRRGTPEEIQRLGY